MPHDTPLDSVSDEYQPVSLRIGWGYLSLLLFVLELVSPFLLRMQSWRPDPLWLWPLVPPAVLLVLSVLGTLSGLLGLKYSPDKGSAKLGLLLNGVVFACFLVVVGAMFVIITGRR